MATRQRGAQRPNPAVRGREVPQKRSFPWVRVLLGVALLIVLGVVWFVFIDWRVPAAEIAPGGPVTVLPTRDHIPDGTKVEYNSNPPTSGNHWIGPATWGIYPTRPPADERLVHNLEHGGIIISYNPDKAGSFDLYRLKRLVRDLQTERKCIILTPRPAIQDDKMIAITAWGMIATFDGYDEAGLRAFWRDHAANGPEFGKGVCG